MKQVLQISRVFNTVRLLSKVVKPPIPVRGVEGEYVTALYSAAFKNKCLKDIERDINKLESLLKKRRCNQKMQKFQQIANKVDLHPYTQNFLQLLIENDRLNILNNIIAQFKLVMENHTEEIIVDVITATALDCEQKQQLEDTLKQSLQERQTLKLNLQVDPSIIGGMVVQIGDKEFDMSVAAKIELFKLKMKKTQSPCSE